jgi:hypothetical protein
VTFTFTFAYLYFYVVYFGDLKLLKLPGLKNVSKAVLFQASQPVHQYNKCYEKLTYTYSVNCLCLKERIKPRGGSDGLTAFVNFG